MRPKALPSDAIAVPDCDPSRGPVFIGGDVRSGKTLVRRALSAHTQIAFSRRTNLWTELYRRHGDLSDPSNLERCLAAALRRKQVASLEPDLERLGHEFAAGPRTYARLFQLLHEHHAERTGRPRWGDQTGLVELFTRELMAAYPGARVIHMVRDPRDGNAAARDKYGSRPMSVGTSTARWMLSADSARRYADVYPDAYRVVRYETLVQAPKRTIRDLCEFIGEDYQPGVADPDDGRSLAITAEHVGQYRRTLDPGHQAVIQKLAGGLMVEFGYEPDEVRQGRRARLRAAATTWPLALAGYGAERIRDAVTFPSQAGDRGSAP